jgi:beta-glucanase (GH16 family)
MKKFLYCWVFFLSACNPNLTVLNPEFHPTDRGWGSHEPVWRDEFNGNVLDSTKWVAAEYCGGYNAEKQCYQPENISFDGNHLIITARVERCAGTTLPADGELIKNENEQGTVTCPNPTGLEPFEYTSARIHTHVLPIDPLNSWRYGRIEIRARLPYGEGTWPAFWMLPVAPAHPWPASGEIDMMETVDLHYPHVAADFLQSDLHFCHWGSYTLDPNPSSTAQRTCSAMNTQDHTYVKVHSPMRIGGLQNWSPDLVSAFHTYAMEWSDHDIRFFVDNRPMGRTVYEGSNYQGSNRQSPPFRISPFYLIINLAIGGRWPAAVNPSTWINQTHAELVIDWVRVYTCVPDPQARNCIYEGTGLGDFGPGPLWPG